jgi:hypothetical protein
MPLHIDGPESGKLSIAIESAYPSIYELDEILKEKLDANIQNFGGLMAKFPQIRDSVIEHYNSRYHTDILVRALLEDRMDNVPLLEFAQRHKITFPDKFKVQGVDAEFISATDGLERMLEPGRGFMDVGTFLTKIRALVNSICQITVPTSLGNEYGTGFLIGNECVLTNWHVVEHVTPANREEVKLLFDFRSGTGGTEYRLRDHDTQWLVAQSPYHSSDLMVEAAPQRLAGTRPEDCLDFAVIRLKESAGEKLVQGQARGFLPLAKAVDDRAAYNAGAAMSIIQHPYDEAQKKVLPLQVDWLQPVQGLNANGTRVLYDVNTRPGSSGSPCLDGRLDLIALHHAGGQDWPADIKYLYNQGIPIGPIRTALRPLLDRGQIV